MPMDAEEFPNEQTLLTYQQSNNVADFHADYQTALDRLSGELGSSHSIAIDGQEVLTDESFRVTSPGNTDRVIGEFDAAGSMEVDRAVQVATDAVDHWRHTPWEERVEIFATAAELMREQKFDLAALMSIEAGKTRSEAIADVDEAIDFLRFYSRELERHEGFQFSTGEPIPGHQCSNTLRPFGVFGVIAPFNFPCAIFTGMTVGALITGNTVVAKPASATPFIAHKVVDILRSAGVPSGVLTLLTGGGRAVGQPLIEHEDVSGIVFTGSREVGRQIQERFLAADKHGPVIAELGGKNPVIVTEQASLEQAVTGVMNGAFGFSGQKCSATSRVYLQTSVFDPFLDRLVEATEDLPIEPPESKTAALSPLIDQQALDRYETICERAQADGTVQTGAERLSRPDLPPGRYVKPTVVTDIDHDHELATEEHFLPFVTLHPIDDLEEGLQKANDSDYGLCAGLFSEAEAEIEQWLDRIESGMCYVNRAQSATTGALVGAQPFGGWKASGTTSKFAGGYWYLQQFMREQSQTIVRDTGQET